LSARKNARSNFKRNVQKLGVVIIVGVVVSLDAVVVGLLVGAGDNPGATAGSALVAAGFED
jgi:hypothetical protein